MNSRTIVVARGEAGRSLAQVLRARLSWSWSIVQRAIEGGQVRVNGVVCRNPEHRMSRGLRVQVMAAKPAKPPARESRPPEKKAKYEGPRPVIRFSDAHLIVVDKPAGLTTMRHPEEAAEFGARAQRFLPPTLADWLTEASQPKKTRVFPVHRLDKDTSGLVVFARTKEAEAHLGRQFRSHTVGRRYLALVRGRAQSRRIESSLVRDRGDGRRGSTPRPGEGKRAVTHVHVVEDLGEFTLVECRLETGRTHQVRIHLGETGTPICGERIYDRPLHGTPLPDRSQAPRLALHAAELAIDHPISGKRLTWTSPLPEDLQKLLTRLRKR